MKHKKLQIDELNFVQSELNYKSKSLNGAYALGVFLGFLGIHRAYLERVKSGINRAILSFATIGVGIVVLVSQLSSSGSDAESLNTLLGLLLLLLLSISTIWWVYDLFKIPQWVEEINTRNEDEAVEKAIQSRYVEEHILKNQIVEEVMGTIMTKVKATINEELDARQLHRKEKSGEDPNFPRLPSPELDITNLTGDLMGVNGGSSTEEIAQLGNNVLNKIVSEEFKEASLLRTVQIMDEDLSIEVGQVSEDTSHRSLEDMIMTEITAMIKKTLDEMASSELISEYEEDIEDYMRLRDSVDDNILYVDIPSDEPEVVETVASTHIVDKKESISKLLALLSNPKVAKIAKIAKKAKLDVIVKSDKDPDTLSGQYSSSADDKVNTPILIDINELDAVDSAISGHEESATETLEVVLEPVGEVISEELTFNEPIEIEIIDTLKPSRIERLKLDVVVNEPIKTENELIESVSHPVLIEIIPKPIILDVIVSDEDAAPVIEAIALKEDEISIEIIKPNVEDIFVEEAEVEEAEVEESQLEVESKYAHIDYDDLVANNTSTFSEKRYNDYVSDKFDSSGRILKGRDINARDFIEIVEGSNKPTKKHQLPTFESIPKDNTDWGSVGLKPLYGEERTAIDEIEDITKLTEEERIELEKSENIKIVGDVVVDKDLYEQRRARALEMSKARAEADANKKVVDSDVKESDNNKGKSKKRRGFFGRK